MFSFETNDNITKNIFCTSNFVQQNNLERNAFISNFSTQLRYLLKIYIYTSTRHYSYIIPYFYIHSYSYHSYIIFRPNHARHIRTIFSNLTTTSGRKTTISDRHRHENPLSSKKPS